MIATTKTLDLLARAQNSSDRNNSYSFINWDFKMVAVTTLTVFSGSINSFAFTVRDYLFENGV